MRTKRMLFADSADICPVCLQVFKFLRRFFCIQGCRSPSGAHQKAFKDQSGSHPKRGIVQAYHPVDICPRLAVIPGAHLIFF